MRIGIDLGGTKIEIIALAGAGQILHRRRIATPQGDYAATLAAIRRLVHEAEIELGQSGSVGIGIPGALSHSTGLVKNANSTCLTGRALQQDLEAALTRPVRLANDANCFALSEATDGAGAGAHCVFGVILGTGVGGGIVIGGQVLEGANAIAGEWGHNPLPGQAEEPAPPATCYCGRNGCIETWLSGPGLASDHFRHSGVKLSPPQLAARARDGDTAAQASLDRHCERLARALAGVINLIDPDVIVLGGGLSHLDHLYHDLPTRWAPHVFSDTLTTRLHRAAHGDASGVRGAAWLWNNDDTS